MTATAEHFLQELRALPPADLRQVWAQVSQRMTELNLPTTAPAEVVPEGEFQAALGEVGSDRTGQNLTDLLLNERHRDRDREQTELENRPARSRHV
jgi:hypothetical protein